MNKEIPIIRVNYGLASRYNNFIEINKKLDKCPELRDKIIAHEKRHDSGKYTKNDFMNDFHSKEQTFIDCFKFCLINREAIINFFPFMYSYYAKRWTFNSSSIFPFALLGLMFVLFFHFTLKLSILYLIFGWIISLFLINLICIIKTHNYVKDNDKK